MKRLFCLLFCLPFTGCAITTGVYVDGFSDKTVYTVDVARIQVVVKEWK